MLDTRSPQEGLLPKIDENIANLAPVYLRAGDRISIYVIDCGTMNAVEDVPADRAQLRNAVDVALSRWTERRELKKKTPCSANTHLWDDLAFVTRRISDRVGWRAIVAVTDGNDRKSQNSSDALLALAQNHQVTIFSLDPFQVGHQGMMSMDDGVGRLSNVCELSGGLRLELYQGSASRRLQQLMQMLRERYILEFPRPPNLKAGTTVMTVRIDDMNAFIRPAGDGIPVVDRALTVDSASDSARAEVARQPNDNSVPATPAEAPLQSENPAAGRPEAQLPMPAPAAVAAKSPETPQQALPSAAAPLFKATTRLTVEDVTVTDGKRMPVHGLLESDFTIKEDGKTQSIRNFEEYGVQRPSQAQPAPHLAPGIYTNALPAAPTTGAVNILLLDDVNTGLSDGLAWSPENVASAKDQSMKYLRDMPDGTQVGILQLDNTLRVVQSFTSDKAALLAAMSSVSPKRVAGANITRPGNANSACAAANMQSQLTVDALTQVAAFVAGIKGRKNLIWFTPGTPWLTKYPAFSGVGCLNDDTQEPHRAYALLTAAEVAVYPIDPRGLFGDPAQSAKSSGNSNPQMAVMQVAAFGSNTAAEHEALKDIADATGGLPFFNRNDLDAALREAIQTGEDYYSLSYAPPISKYDGKYHAIEVKVDLPTLHLQYRAGYTSVDPTRSTEARENSSAENGPMLRSELLAAMSHGEAASTKLLFDVQAAPSTSPAKPGESPLIGVLSPEPKRTHLARYVFSYTLASDQVTFVDSPDGMRKAAIEFAFAVYDGKGRMLSSLSQTAKLSLRPEEVSRFMQRPFQIPLQFDLPAGNIFVRLGVVDVPSGKLGTLEIPETVPK